MLQQSAKDNDFGQRSNLQTRAEGAKRPWT